MPILKDFKSFAVKGNMVDLAVGVIIGGAFGRVITAIVDDLVMPLLNPLMPKGRWREWTISPGVKLGDFLSTALDFLIVSVVIFIVVQILHGHREKHEAKKAAEVSSTDRLLTDIREEMRAMRREITASKTVHPRGPESPARSGPASFH
jgi:large conductance mechanosensitive channel